MAEMASARTADVLLQFLTACLSLGLLPCQHPAMHILTAVIHIYCTQSMFTVTSLCTAVVDLVCGIYKGCIHTQHIAIDVFLVWCAA